MRQPPMDTRDRVIEEDRVVARRVRGMKLWSISYGDRSLQEEPLVEFVDLSPIPCPQRYVIDSRGLVACASFSPVKAGWIPM